MCVGGADDGLNGGHEGFALELDSLGGIGQWLLLFLLADLVAKGIVEDDSAAHAASVFLGAFGLGANITPACVDDSVGVGAPLEQTWINFFAWCGCCVNTPSLGDLLQSFGTGVGSQGGVDDCHRQTRPLADNVFEDVVVEYRAAEEREIGIVEVCIGVGGGCDETSRQRLQGHLLRQR